MIPLHQDLDDQDRLLFCTRASRFWAQHVGPSVGDFIVYADGVTRRIAHIWDDDDDIAVQASMDTDARFYLNDGFCTHSGGLAPGIPEDVLIPTGNTQEGAVWFFHHDSHRAGNVVETHMPFAVYTSARLSD